MPGTTKSIRLPRMATSGSWPKARSSSTGMISVSSSCSPLRSRKRSSRPACGADHAGQRRRPRRGRRPACGIAGRAGPAAGTRSLWSRPRRRPGHSGPGRPGPGRPGSGRPDPAAPDAVTSGPVSAGPAKSVTTAAPVRSAPGTRPPACGSRSAGLWARMPCSAHQAVTEAISRGIDAVGHLDQVVPGRGLLGRAARRQRGDQRVQVQAGLGPEPQLAGRAGAARPAVPATTTSPWSTITTWSASRSASSM